jgi:hypothetical protein
MRYYLLVRIISKKNRAKLPGTTAFTPNTTGLKTDPGAFSFCQIEPNLSSFHHCYEHCLVIEIKYHSEFDLVFPQLDGPPQDPGQCFQGVRKQSKRT